MTSQTLFAHPRAGDISRIEDLTRREFMFSAFGAALLIACGEDGDEDPDTSRATVTADTPYGTFEVPLQPQRLVILEGRQDLEVAVALGLPKPVGLGQNSLGPDGALSPFVPFTTDGIEMIHGGETPVEKVLAMNPDLIIGRDLNIEEIQEALVRTAPVLPAERRGVDWRTTLTDMGAWTGRDSQATEAIAGYDEHVDEVKARHADTLKTATVAMLQPGGDGQWHSCNSDGFYLQARTTRDLGANYLAALDETKQEASAYGPPGAMLNFSNEHLNLLEPADLLLVVVNSEEVRSALNASPLWQSLPAVKANRVRYTDYRTNSGSVYSAHECVKLWDEAFTLLA